MYLDTRTGRVNTDRISPADAYFSIRLAEMAWHAVPTILSLLVIGLFAPAFIVWELLIHESGMDPQVAIGYALGTGAFFWLLMVCRAVIRLRARRAARLKIASEWTPQGALQNPPAPWFDSDGRALWVRQGDSWVPAASTVAPVAIVAAEPSLRATRSERLISR